MNEMNIDALQLLCEQREKIGAPSQDVGTVPAVAGVLFFNDAHTPQVRDAIAACFDEYRVLAEPHLTWLYREDPPQGPAKNAYAQAPSLREMLARMDADDALSFHYVSGTRAQDAGPWEFQVHGVPAWRALAGDWGLSALRFCVPSSYVDDNPAAFQAMFLGFAKRLHARHGYGGHSLVLSALRYDDNQAFEALVASRLRGFDAGNLVSGAVNAHLGIKTVSWLTAVSHELIARAGGVKQLRSELPGDWFAFADYGAGLVIQGGPVPEAAPVDSPMPARLVLPNMLLRSVRMPKVRLHFATAADEPRLIGPAADEWLKRFDVDEAELPRYQARLRNEPSLIPTSTIPTGDATIMG